MAFTKTKQNSLGNMLYFVDIQKQRELKVFPELFKENGYMGETIWTNWNKLETYIKTELNNVRNTRNSE